MTEQLNKNNNTLLYVCCTSTKKNALKETTETVTHPNEDISPK